MNRSRKNQEKTKIDAHPLEVGRKIENTLGRRVINSVQQRRGVEEKKKQDFDKDALIRKQIQSIADVVAQER